MSVKVAEIPGWPIGVIGPAACVVVLGSGLTCAASICAKALTCLYRCWLYLTQADGRAEWRAAIDMINRRSPGSTRRLTLGADKGFDSADFVADCA